MTTPFLAGKKLYLRPLEPADIGAEYADWLNDHEVARYLETGRFPTTVEDLQAYARRFQGSASDVILAIVDRASGRHIGNVTLNRISWIHRTADTGLMIGAKDFWGKGYATEAWSLILDYAFRRLGLRKVIAGAYEGNEASIKALTKLGFKLEGRLRREFYADGDFVDALRFGLLREEFRPAGGEDAHGASGAGVPRPGGVPPSRPVAGPGRPRKRPRSS